MTRVLTITLVVDDPGITDVFRATRDAAKDLADKLSFGGDVTATVTWTDDDILVGTFPID